ncbi:unnamed protein product [Ambrosiozyma monospora]|uniref:Unnamed protein product n=1 Tax=Ambrosiozyma monospora TaxID=43982 RepID=A0A9W6YUS4_AMBMO|nr:unnamed protein product [Ambrosiozyma monospora]
MPMLTMPTTTAIMPSNTSATNSTQTSIYPSGLVSIDIEPSFTIKYPTQHRVFSPQFSDVQGSVKLKFLQDLRVLSVKATFIGLGRTYYRLVHIDTSESKRSTMDYYDNNLIFSLDDALFQSSTEEPHTSGNVNTSISHQQNPESLLNIVEVYDQSNPSPRSGEEQLQQQINDSDTNHNDNDDEQEPSGVGTFFAGGTDLDCNFNFAFPKRTKSIIPSSCSGFGVKKHDNCYVDVTYSILITIEYTNSDVVSTKVFSIPIHFQDGIACHLMDHPNNYKHYHSYTFRGKLKQLMPHPVTGELVPLEQTVGLVKKSKWRKVNKYDDPSRDVHLGLIVEIPTRVNFADTLKQIPIQFQSEHIKAFQDFKFRGESTKLGFFSIEEVHIDVIQSVEITNHKREKNYATKLVTPIYYFAVSEAPIECKPTIDIADFTFDERSGKFVYTTTLDSLLPPFRNSGGHYQIQKGSTIYEMMVISSISQGTPSQPKTIVGAANLNRFLHSSNSFRVRICLSNSQQKAYEPIWFEYYRNVRIIRHELASNLMQTGEANDGIFGDGFLHEIKWNLVHEKHTRIFEPEPVADALSTLQNFSFGHEAVQEEPEEGEDEELPPPFDEIDRDEVIEVSSTMENPSPVYQAVAPESHRRPSNTGVSNRYSTGIHSSSTSRFGALPMSVPSTPSSSGISHRSSTSTAVSSISAMSTDHNFEPLVTSMARHGSSATSIQLSQDPRNQPTTNSIIRTHSLVGSLLARRTSSPVQSVETAEEASFEQTLQNGYYGVNVTTENWSYDDGGDMGDLKKRELKPR